MIWQSDSSEVYTMYMLQGNTLKCYRSHMDYYPDEFVLSREDLIAIAKADLAGDTPELLDQMFTGV